MIKEYQITVNDSVFRTKRQGLHMGILFIGCFIGLLLLYSLVTDIWNLRNTYVEEFMPEVALVISVLIVLLYYFIREKRTNGVMQLNISFLNDSLKIIINRKQYVIKYTDITEVCKIMVIDRMHDEKGCYRMKIKCHGRSNLEFETTQQEYDVHLDFEKTELFNFYEACKKAGLKCC